MTDKPDPWAAFCAFAKHPYRDQDPRERWDIATTPRLKIKTRKRKMTLVRALKQATRAGLSVSEATIKPDGVTLQLGEATPDQANPWDSVQ